MIMKTAPFFRDINTCLQVAIGLAMHLLYKDGMDEAAKVGRLRRGICRSE
ncbi:hypothetical protein HJA95_27925 [Rhizobium binae]|nr:hypothetical protein [Rhizobium binae]MBX4953323.1 hypothetical protein [Rhizobium binae]